MNPIKILRTVLIIIPLVVITYGIVKAVMH